MIRRTFFLIASLGLSLITGITVAVEAGKPIASLDELRALCKQATERQRPVIFNNDGNEPVYLCHNTTPEELLGHRVDRLALHGA